MFPCLNRVDWDLLYRQKAVLVELASGERLTPAEMEALWGIVHLLDALQDDAVADGRWQFPDSREQKGGA